MIGHRRNIAEAHFWYVTAGIAGCAMIASMVIGMMQSVWFDEAYSILVAKSSLGQVLHLAAVDTHPPLYYLLLHVWGGLFGWSEFALRSLSVLAYGAMIVVAMMLMRRLFDARTAIISGSLLLVAPLLMRYGFELRMYSIAMLIGVGATYALVRARDAKKAFWWWASYSALLAIGLATLYYLALLWVAHVVWLVITTRTEWRNWLRASWVWSYVSGALLFLPQLPTFLSQMNNGALAAIGQPMNLEQSMGVITFNTVYKPLWQISIPETVIVLAVIAIVVFAMGRSLFKGSHRNAYLLVTCYWVVPIGVLMVVSLSRSMYVERYLSHIAVGLILWVGLVLTQMLSARQIRYRRWYYGVVVAAMCAGVVHLALVGNFNFQRMQKPAIDQVAMHIGDCRDATIIAADPYVATELSYYLPEYCDMKFYSEQQFLGGGYAPYSDSPHRLASLSVLVPTKRVYYAYYGEPKLQIDTRFVRHETQEYGNMKIATYETTQ
jgi:mannosyltransferase